MCTTHAIAGRSRSPRRCIHIGTARRVLHRLVAFTDVENEAAARLVDVLGLRHEGRLRHNAYRYGQWRDEHIIALVADDWPAAGYCWLHESTIVRKLRGVSKGESTRQAVLERAAEVASRLGLSGLTIGSLANEVELSKSGLFGHFRSKEALQLQVLALSRETFTDQVVRPALSSPRGEPRLRALFERWLVVGRESAPGCLFVSAATEFDDQPGVVRDQLVSDYRDLMESLALIFRSGVTEGQFKANADAEQFVHELHGIMLAYFHSLRLMGDPAAEAKTRRAFERLVADARI